ncbi:hypothetical protein [Natronorarus salvus]|uniref:hypothetical protein n=1 Tax=Natronorarus salvus TaxID=3117733 RepID=UPI002F26D684
MPEENPSRLPGACPFPIDEDVPVYEYLERVELEEGRTRYRCPTCAALFRTDEGLAIHHSRVHEITLTERLCGSEAVREYVRARYLDGGDGLETITASIPYVSRTTVKHLLGSAYQRPPEQELNRLLSRPDIGPQHVGLSAPDDPEGHR